MTSGTGQSIEARVKQAVEDGNRGDFAQLRALFTQDAVLHADCDGPLSGVQRDREACFASFASLSALLDDTLRIDISEMMVSDPFVMMFGHVRGTRDPEGLDGGHNRAELDEPLCVIWRFADGKCAEIFGHLYRPAAWDAFWRFQDYEAARARQADSVMMNREEVRTTVAQIAREANFAVLRDFFAPDVVSYHDGASPIGGRKSGIDELLGGFPRLHALCQGQMEVTNEQVLVNEYFASMTNRVRATRNGRSMEQVLCVTWRIEDSKVRNSWLHIEDATAFDRFWAD